MRVRKVVFSWDKIYKDKFIFGNIDKLDIVFEEGIENPVIFIDAVIVKIEDRMMKIDNKEILKKIGEIDFETNNKYQRGDNFSGGKWKLIVNDKIYEGVFEEPSYVKQLKAVIRYTAIWEYASKKLANYLK